MAKIRVIIFICAILTSVYTKDLSKLNTAGVKTAVDKANAYETAKQDVENYIHEKLQDINTRYKPLYHVSPPVGWMNDPNGFSYFNGRFHLFYQFYPYDSIWGPMHWGHVTSKDLVTWEQMPTALLPEEEMCFSGGAVIDGDIFTLFYTGRKTIDTDPFFEEGQYIAYSEDGVNFHKYEGNPVLPRPPNGSPDFRDPKVWKHDDDWYVVIGSKTEEETGQVLLYKSKDLKDWEYLTVIGEPSKEMGYMWECPDFFELDGKFILLMSPQGLEPKGDRFKNLYQTGYIIGSFNYDTYEFVQEVEFQEIDFGHDFYAATTLEVDGIRYLIAWNSMWESLHLEAEDGWSGSLTIARELKLEGNKIIMTPVQGIESLREDIAFNDNMAKDDIIEFGKAVELIVTSDFSDKVELFLQGTDGGGQVWLRSENGKVVVDRGSEDVRQIDWNPSGSWRIFLDASSLELFCGGGELVFSSRVYPLGGWKLTNLGQDVFVEAYNLNRGI